MGGDGGSGVASFQWADERRLSRLRATGELDRFVVASSTLLGNYKDARLESAVLELRGKDRGCEASLRVSYAARPGSLGLKRGWVRLQSTGEFEQEMLSAVAKALDSAEPRTKARQTPARRAGLATPAEGVSVAGLSAGPGSDSDASESGAETQLVHLGVAH